MAKRKCDDMPGVRAERARNRIEGKFPTLVTQGVNALPGIIADCKPEAAARILLDLIKIYLALPLPEKDYDCLDCSLEEIARANGDHYERSGADEPDPTW